MRLNDGTDAGEREVRDGLNMELVAAVCPASWMVGTMAALFDYAQGEAALPSGSFPTQVHDLHREIDQRLKVLGNMKRFLEACVRNASNTPETEDAFKGEFKLGAAQRRYSAADNTELYLAAMEEGIDPGAFAAACPAMTLAGFAELMGLSRQAALERFGNLFKDTVVPGSVRREYE